jgi:pimeloyl-ACP methyl ester carboxylesterase
MRGELFKFTNVRGHAVKGIMYGSAPSHGLGVLYLPGIVLGATAVHRLGIELAHRLAKDGHTTCLFDPAGVGESDSDYPAGTHRELSAWVESGSFVDDTLQALDFLAERAGLRRMVLVGHCGGALTAMYAAARHPAACGALLISPPTTANDGLGDDLDRDGFAKIYLHQYARKLMSQEAWLRLVSGHSSYRTILRLVLGRIHRKVGVLLTPPASRPARAFNPRLVAAFAAAHAEHKRISIVFGDRDPELDDFRAFHREHVPAKVETRVFGNTSHGFVTEHSMALLFDEVRRFVRAAATPDP